jgi:hypothetical protein
MLIFQKIYSIIGFKITWLSCIVGEVYIGSWFGFFIGLIYLSIYFTFPKNNFTIFKIILTISFVGYFFDSILSYLEFYKITAEINLLYLPIWFLILWPSFCCLLVDIFLFLDNKNFISFFLGSICGTLSYYAGVSVGLAEIGTNLTFFIIFLFWGLLFFCYSKFIIKKIIPIQ